MYLANKYLAASITYIMSNLHLLELRDHV